jgi:hypothetical protein
MNNLATCFLLFVFLSDSLFVLFNYTFIIAGNSAAIEILMKDEYDAIWNEAVVS